MKNYGAELAWRIVQPDSGAPLLAVIFETRYYCDARAPFEIGPDVAWTDTLATLAIDSRVPTGSSHVMVDTFFRHVSAGRHIHIIKRNERRFWTKSAAREDAEATLLQAMILHEGGKSE